MTECDHDFTAGPNCSRCGLHAVTVDGGSLSPRRITELLRAGRSVAVLPDNPDDPPELRDADRFDPRDPIC